MLYTHARKAAMLEEVRRIAELLTLQSWYEDGAYIISNDGQMIINIYDYSEEFDEAQAKGFLKQHIKALIDAQKEKD